MDTLTTKGYIKIIFRTVMADYAIVIKACSKIVCHALSRIKQRQCYGYCLQALLGYLLSINT